MAVSSALLALTTSLSVSTSLGIFVFLSSNVVWLDNCAICTPAIPFLQFMAFITRRHPATSKHCVQDFSWLRMSVLEILLGACPFANKAFYFIIQVILVANHLIWLSETCISCINTHASSYATRKEWWGSYNWHQDVRIQLDQSTFIIILPTENYPKVNVGSLNPT